jgi:2-methylcitrate dehydratase PrpD
MIDGEASEPQFSDARVRDPQVVALRSHVSATVDPTVAEDAAVITVVLHDGRRLEKRVAHAIGSLAHPMTDRDLETKFHGLCDPVLGAGKTAALIRECWRLAQLNDVAQLSRLTVPD